MNEELNIKIKLDTSAITPAVNKLKNEVSNVNKQVKTSLSRATSSSSDKQFKSTGQLSKLLDKTEKAVNNIKGGISGWDIAKTVIGIKGIEYAFNGAKKSVKELGNIIGNTFDGHLFNAISFSLKGETDSAKIELEEFKYVVKGRMKQIKESLGGAFSNLKSGNLKGSLTSLKIALTGGANVGKTFKATMKSIGVLLTSLATIVGTLTVALAGLVGIMGVVAAFKISKLGNEVYHTAQQFGFSTKAFQEWSYIMERSGSTVENLRDLLENLNSEQGEVITGSEDAAQNFRNLGISAEEVAKMDSQTLFETVITRLQGIEDATLRSGYAYELFGDQASRLMNIINMSSSEMGVMINQYHLLGGAMSGELIEKSNSLRGSIENMKQAWQGLTNTLATVFIPIVQAVVNWITKAIVIVNLFFKSIFGLDLESTTKSTEKAVNSANKYTGGLKAATKAAEQLKRTTMGFDELNIVQDPNKSYGGGDAGGGDTSGVGIGGAGLPSIDLSQWQGEIPEWIKWIAENKDIVISGLLGIASGLAAITLGLKPIQALGIGVALAGIIFAVQSLIKFLQDPTFENFTNIIIGIGTAIIGVGIIIGNIPLIVAGVITLIVATIVKNYDYILELFNKLIKWFETDFVRGLRKLFGPIGDIIAAPFIFAVNGMKGAFEGLFGGVKKIVNGIVQIFKGDFKKGIINVFGGLIDIMLAPVNALVSGINSLIRGVNRIRFNVPDWVPGFGGKKFGFNIPQIPRLAEGGIATRSVLANIGEAGKEAVLPLEYNTEWMDTLADKIAARNSGPTKIVLKVGEKELGWATIDSINSITKQTGAIQLTL